MKEITKAYKCDFCGRLSTSSGGMKRHEICCHKNPANRSMCAWCRHLKKTEYIEYEMHYTRDIPYKVTEFYCEKIDKKLYHPKVLRFYEDLKEKILMDADMQMPTEDTGCPYYETETF